MPPLLHWPLHELQLSHSSLTPNTAWAGVEEGVDNIHSKHLLIRKSSRDPENSQLYSSGAILEDTPENSHITHHGRDGHVLSCPFPGFGLVALAECQ